jgi:hypothetical protein
MTELELIKRIEELETRQAQVDKKIDLAIKWINDNVPKKRNISYTDGPIMNPELWHKQLNLNERED